MMGLADMQTGSQEKGEAGDAMKMEYSNRTGQALSEQKPRADPPAAMQDKIASIQRKLWAINPSQSLFPGRRLYEMQWEGVGMKCVDWSGIIIFRCISCKHCEYLNEWKWRDI